VWLHRAGVANLPEDYADAVIAMKALEAICATTVQPEVLKKLVSDLQLSHGKSQCQKQLGESGGEGGIRTPGTSVSSYNGLANRRLQPLGHLSAVCFP
jgi:hypothetical protein